MAKHAGAASMQFSLTPQHAGVRAETQNGEELRAEASRTPRTRFLADQLPAVQIRPYTLADIPAVLRLPGKVLLDLPDALVIPGSGALDLPAALPLLRRDRPTFVATAGDQPIGFARFSPQRPDGRWILASTAAETGVYPQEPVWEALMAYGVRAAGLRGVRRLYARVPLGQALLQVLVRGGWNPYARETIFRADRVESRPTQGRSVRPQEPADTWAIHQLYAASVPRKVQEIEALTSHFWHMERTRRRSRRRENGWLIERDGQLAAYARFTRGTNAGMIEFVVPPGERELFGLMLDAALARTGRGKRPIYCVLRSYLADHGSQLRERGFMEIGEQDLLIRYTTAVVKVPANDPVLFPVDLRPAMPRRVPTFLEGQPMDGAL